MVLGQALHLPEFFRFNLNPPTLYNINRVAVPVLASVGTSLSTSTLGQGSPARGRVHSRGDCVGPQHASAWQSPSTGISPGGAIPPCHYVQRSLPD